MQTLIDYATAAPGAVRAVYGLEQYVQQSGLDHGLVTLVKLRASYMNGCAYCVDMHTQDARVEGESEQRLFAVPVWRETPFFSARERAAFEWTEAVTNVRDGVSESLLESMQEHFSDAELVNLTVAVIAINAWNRLAVPFRKEVGTYRPKGALR